MEILGGRELDAAVARALGHEVEWQPCYRSHDDGNWYGCGGWKPERDSEMLPCILIGALEDGVSQPVYYHESDDLTWAVVDGLREKGWWLDLKQPISPNNPGCYCSLQRGAVAWGAEHLKRITAILNAGLLAYDAAN